MSADPQAAELALMERIAQGFMVESEEDMTRITSRAATRPRSTAASR
jgi:hypothetical protein